MECSLWLWERRGDVSLVIAEDSSVQALKKRFPKKRLYANRYKLEWRDLDENVVRVVKEFDSGFDETSMMY